MAYRGAGAAGLDSALRASSTSVHSLFSSGHSADEYSATCPAAQRLAARGHLARRRLSPSRPTVPSVLLIGSSCCRRPGALVSACAGGNSALPSTWRRARRLRGLYLVGGTPWVTGKALAIASPALLAARADGRRRAVDRGAPARWADRPGAARARRRRAVVERARLPRRDARAARAAGGAAAHRRAGRGQGTRRSSTNTKSTPTGTSCAKALRSSRPSTAPSRCRCATARPDQGGLGRPRRLPALDARTLPLDRHAPLARGKPSAVDLPAGLAGPLLPAVAAPGGPDDAHHRARPARRIHRAARSAACAERPHDVALLAQPGGGTPLRDSSRPRPACAGRARATRGLPAPAAPVVAARRSESRWPGTWTNERPPAP